MYQSPILQDYFTKKLSELDRLVKNLTTLPRQSKISYGADKNMPRLLWKDGITNMTDITASQKVGIVGSIYLQNIYFTYIYILHVKDRPCYKEQTFLKEERF